MKNLRCLLAVFLFAVFSFAQDVKKDDWFRVQSDDGEFSIEVPAKYGYFYDKEGTSVANLGEIYNITEMSVFNSYAEHTLLSFERYKGSKKALDVIADNDKEFAKWQKTSADWSEIKKDGFKIKQLIIKSEKQYTVRQYFYSKNNIYLLIASSHSGETQAMKRFFDALTFKPDVNSELLSNESRFSRLKATDISYLEELEDKKSSSKPKPSTTPKLADSNMKMFLILTQPRASYTESARKAGLNGVVRIKVSFSEFGQITKIVVRRALKYGLVYNAILAAMRIKILPPEEDDKPVATEKTIEYRFTLY
jgi:TonB family protein